MKHKKKCSHYENKVINLQKKKSLKNQAEGLSPDI
jgi:hypothetical protein